MKVPLSDNPATPHPKSRPLTLLRWLTRRLVVPTVIAAVVGRAVFSIAMYGFEGLGTIFIDAQDAAYTLVLVFVTVAAVAAAALVLRRTALPGWLRAPLLLLVGSLAAWSFVYALTGVGEYADPAVVPAIATTIVWMLCNLDMLKRSKRDIADG